MTVIVLWNPKTLKVYKLSTPIEIFPKSVLQDRRLMYNITERQGAWTYRTACRNSSSTNRIQQKQRQWKPQGFFFFFKTAFHFTSQIQRTMHMQWQMLSQQADNHHQPSSILESTFPTFFVFSFLKTWIGSRKRVVFKYLSTGALKETEHTHMHTA